MPAFSQLRNPSEVPTHLCISPPDAVSASKLHTHESILQTHSSLRWPHRRLLPTCALRNNHRLERPCVSGVDTNHTKRHDSLSTARCRHRLPYPCAFEPHDLSVYMRALPPSLSIPICADPRRATPAPPRALPHARRRRTHRLVEAVEKAQETSEASCGVDGNGDGDGPSQPHRRASRSGGHGSVLLRVGRTRVRCCVGVLL